MKLSQYFLATKREDAKDAEVISHHFMLRSGMLRKVASGIYDLLPTGLRVVRKVENIIRQEMNRSGAIELLMPLTQPADFWQETGRYEQYGKELLRFTDRNERSFVLGPTHEEIITDIVRAEVASYKQLPINLYQIQLKFRDEIRPRFGLMRGREFLMKDAYSFHATEESLDAQYHNMVATYRRIFNRCGLNFRDVRADTGSIGGNSSHEFMVLADTGEDTIVCCDKCDYAANTELAVFRQEQPRRFQTPSLPSIEVVQTPTQKTIDDVANFLAISPKQLIKSLLYETSSGFIMVCIRGDLDIAEAKIKTALTLEWLKLAEPATIVRLLGTEAGFLGPVNLPQEISLICDYSVATIETAVTGANQTGQHLKNVVLDRDYHPKKQLDLAQAKGTEPCKFCQDGHLVAYRGIEVGHVFKLGTKYSQAMQATFLDQNGKSQPVIMGCYGIGVGRTAAAAIEQNHDSKGPIWPKALAPFEVIICILDPKQPELIQAAESLYVALQDQGIDVALDDRDERPGVKLTDAELLGAPLRIVFGRKSFERGVAELTLRRSQDTQEAPLSDILNIALTTLATIS